MLLPWEIVQCHSEAVSIREFFTTNLLPRFGLSEFDRPPEVRLPYLYMY